MARRKPDRWRCLTVGCNPLLRSQKVAEQHREQTGHRIACWPVRSEEGKRKQHERRDAHREALGPTVHQVAQLECELGWDEHKLASP